jgi:hypothetical protein
MAVTKVYIKGNYLRLDIDGSIRILEDSRAEVNVQESSETVNNWVIQSDNLGKHEIPFSDLRDESNTPYSVLGWETFYTENTGFNPAPGGSGATSRLYKYTVDVYNDLLSIVDAGEGDIARVYNPTGIWGVNRKNEGAYTYLSGIWEYGSRSLQTEILSNDADILANQIQIIENTRDLELRVTQSNKDTTIGGVIDSTKEYFLDGIIDMGTTQITVPVGGITIRGGSFGISGLTSSEDNYTMFISETALIGSGDFLGFDYLVEVSGTNSKVYDLYDATGFNAIEFSRVNYNNCTSLGDLHNYRQGLEVGTGRFGGSPSLCLNGTWLGGYRISTSIVRSLSAAMTEPLLKAGASFVMNSRFLTDINVDLPALAPLLDFSDTNFPNPSTLEIRDAIVTRNGTISPNDTNITPNIQASNLSCSWKGNKGINNTFVGAIATVTVEVLTTIATVSVPVVLAGTFVNTDLQHFDSPANGQLRHLGDNPREYTVNFDFVLEGGSNDDYKIELVKNDGANSVVYQQTRVVNNLSGGRDVAYFTGLANIILNKNEYVFWQITNLTNNANCTLELDSSWSVEER